MSRAQCSEVVAEIIEEINALRKDREALNRVRSAVEVKS